MQTEIIFEARIGASQHLDVGSGREEFFALAPHNEHVHGFVHACCQNRLIELAHHLVAVGVGRGMIDLDDRQPLFHPIVHELSQHGCPLRPYVHRFHLARPFPALNKSTGYVHHMPIAMALTMGKSGASAQPADGLVWYNDSDVANPRYIGQCLIIPVQLAKDMGRLELTGPAASPGASPRERLPRWAKTTQSRNTWMTFGDVFRSSSPRAVPRLIPAPFAW